MSPNCKFATLTIRQSFATAHRVLRAQSTVVSVAILAFVDPLRVCGSENSIVLFCDVLATVWKLLCCSRIFGGIFELVEVAENLSLPLVRFSSSLLASRMCKEFKHQVSYPISRDISLSIQETEDGFYYPSA